MGCAQSDDMDVYGPNGVTPEVPYLKMRSFEKVEVVGRGSSVTVWKLRDKRDGSLLAGKCILKGSKRFEWSDLYKREINMIHSLAYFDGVVNLFGVSSPPGEFWQLMELGAGGNLYTWMKTYPKTAVSIAQQLVDIVRHLHSRLVSHGDLKPCNVVVTENGHARLIDFEFARELNPGEKVASRLEGTKGYQGPEVFGQAKYCPLMADVFALGMTLQVVASAKPDWYGLTKVIEKMTVDDPERRPSAVEVAAVLRRSLIKHRQPAEESIWISPIRSLVNGSASMCKTKSEVLEAYD